jgi:hypothetical protein
MKQNHAHVLFVVLLIAASWFYGYHQLLFEKPQSIHQWRQADCASIALNYYQNGLNFFAPETHNLTSDGGTSGKCMTSEIPVLYYSAALLYKLFGPHDFLFRLLNTLIFLLGLFYLFKTLWLFSNNFFWSAGLSLLLFTSPVLIYYGNNFLSNSAAFAFTLLGWYHFSRFLLRNRTRYFHYSLLLFLLAAAFKVTSLLSLLAISGIYFLEVWNIKRTKNLTLFFLKKRRFLMPVAAVFCFISGWLIYAHSFNQAHDSHYFSTTIFPIWNYNPDEILKILNQIHKTWGDQYFHGSVFLFLLICLIFIYTQGKKANAFFLWLIPLLFLGGLAYFLLQFWTFRDHDYYTIDLFILSVIVLLSSIHTLKQHHEKWLNAKSLKVAFGILLVFNLIHGRANLVERYSSKYNNKQSYETLYSIEPYLRSLGISPDDRIISIPDQSHLSLYLMNQKGWTEYTDQHFNRGEAYRYNADSLSITQSIERGARYLIINGLSELYKKPYLQSFCGQLFGKHEEVYIFKLNGDEKNFRLLPRQIKKTYRCSAEQVSADSLYFINENQHRFENGQTQSNAFARSGNYSCKLDQSSPFGMTMRVNDLKAGESFRISVWRKSTENPDAGAIIVSAENYYNKEFKRTEKDQNGWEKIEKEVFISSDLEGKELGIYLYHRGHEAVWFDDFAVTHYEAFRFETTNNSRNLIDLKQTPAIPKQNRNDP